MLSLFKKEAGLSPGKSRIRSVDKLHLASEPLSALPFVLLYKINLWVKIGECIS